MSCNVMEISENRDLPLLAGNYRFLLGLIMMFVGLFIGLFSDVQGHGLGFLLFFGSPFVIFTDRKEFTK